MTDISPKIEIRMQKYELDELLALARRGAYEWMLKELDFVTNDLKPEGVRTYIIEVLKPRTEALLTKEINNV